MAPYPIRRVLMTQAERLFLKFGGPRPFHRALSQVGVKRNPATIYKWTYNRERGGTGGIVPTRMWPFIVKASRLEGIYLNEKDMDPRPREVVFTVEHDGTTSVSVSQD